MPLETELITVFRSADDSAESDAAEMLARLQSAGIKAIVLGDDAPGVMEGSWEVRVPSGDLTKAEAIVAAPGPEPEDESEVPAQGMSHSLDFVSVFREQSPDAEMEAISIQSLLEANEIPCVVIGSSQIPSFPFEVRVPKSRLEEAARLLREVRESSAKDED